MRIKIEQIGPSGFRCREDLSPQLVAKLLACSGVEEYHAVGEGRAEFEILRKGSRVQVDGWIETAVESTCVRCLEPAGLSLVPEVHLVLHPRGGKQNGVAGKAEVELVGEQLDEGYYENDEIDLEEIIRQSLLLSLPMNPVCREECPGLCPVCGGNLGHGECGCQKISDDPPIVS